MAWWRRKGARTDSLVAESVLLLGQLQEAAEMIRRAAREALDAAEALKAAAERRIEEESGRHY